MKYEMIFGDAGLFDGAPECATHATKGGGFYYVDSGIVKFISNMFFGARDVCGLAGYLVAERRIIAEPKRWTWEDKKAGRLPEVGSLIIEVESQDSFEFVGVCAGSKRFAVKDVLDGLIYFYNKDVISPIEPPAEKAQRLRDEWIDSSMQKIKRRNWTDAQTFSQIKEFIGDIYDAQLSGELQAPKWGE